MAKTTTSSGGNQIQLDFIRNNRPNRPQGRLVDGYLPSGYAAPAPGWRLGFGQLQGGDPSGGATWIPPFWNQDVGKYTYIWVEPDGTRRTLIGGATISTDLYLSNDSSQIEYNKQTGVLRLRNGTQIRFTTPTDALGQAVGNEMLPAEIKDRNGNYIDITNEDVVGRWAITRITDTLGRVIEFRYENGFLTEVGQQRDSEWRSLIKLFYAPITVQTDFSGVIVDPPDINGRQIWEPWFIEFPNQLNYRFFYTSYCQVYQIEKWVPTIEDQGQAHWVAYSWYDLPSMNGQSEPGGALKPPSNNNTPQTDCPKFATRNDWAKNWNNEAEATHLYTYFTNADGSRSGKIVDPLGRVYRTDVTLDGLTHTSRVWADETSYREDPEPDPALKTITTVYQSFTDGPQIVSVTAADESSAKKTGYIYETVNGVTLLTDATEYSDNGVTKYRRTQTIYNSNPAYSSRHIFGLPERVSVYAGADLVNPIAETQFSYDEAAYFDATSFSAFQHDSASYDGYFIGRGNLTTVTQYEIPGGGSRAVRRIKYDKTGQPTEGYDAANNVAKFFYDDNFSNKPATIGETHALLTKAQDADGFCNRTKYDWHTAQPVESFHLAGLNGTGAAENTITFSYDFVDRLNVIDRPDGGRTTYEYWDNWLGVASFERIDTPSGQDRQYYSVSMSNGAGGLLKQATDHPDGVSGKYTAVQYELDAAGRTKKVSNATAVNGEWIPIDDDAAGYLYTTFDRDALDRVVKVTRPDADILEYEYEGCGCAGGWTVTSRDERGKQRRQIYDFLGRLCRSQQLDANPTNPTVYNQARHIYDARDLLLRIEHSGGDENYHQDRTFAYDGYGRLQSENTPEGGTVNYTYNPDDQVETVTDGRGITATYDYNRRGLVKQVLYSDETPDVFYDYGEYGERLWMQEKDSAGNEIGRTDYGYDPYKRLQNETRKFNGLTGTHRIGYEYNYAGLLVKLTCTVDAWVKQINSGYTYGLGLASVGTDLIDVGDPTSNIVNGLSYRGFGGIKQLRCGNGQQLDASYSLERQQPARLVVIKPGEVTPIIDLTYDYENGEKNNGRIQKITDGRDSRFTTTYTYDDYQRLEGAAATAYQRQYGYDPWGNLRSVTASGLGLPSYNLSYDQDVNGTPLSNRISDTGYVYDQCGNLTTDGELSYTYDAAGRLKTANMIEGQYDYDGNGRRIRQSNSTGTIQYLWSSVLGEPVVELDNLGGVYRAYVYSPSGQLLALQANDYQFYWVHTDHLGSARRLTDGSGTEVYRAEFDPHGQVLEEWSADGKLYKNSHKYTGYERDWTTGLDNAKARMYASKVGRFIQPDPLGVAAADPANPQSLNRYSYVGNDPVNATDPIGLLPYIPSAIDGWGGASGGFWGGGWDFNDRPRAGARVLIEGEVRNFPWTGIRIPGFEGQYLPFLSMFAVYSLWGGYGGQKSGCPSVPEAPEGADVNENIRIAANIRFASGDTGRPILWGSAALSLAAGRYFTFYNFVKAGGPWDYKLQDKTYETEGRPSRFVDFGNFNYGAAGIAAGFTEGQLLRLARRAQQQDTPGTGAGTPVGLAKALMGIGGVAPFGDERSDVNMIKQGIKYAQNKCFPH